MKRFFITLSVVFTVCCLGLSSSHASTYATYNPVTGAVNIPSLQVQGSSTYYSVQMQQQTQGLNFAVTGATVAATPTSASYTATYNAITGSVVIPYITVAGDTSGTSYTVNMQLVSGLFFAVSNISTNTNTGYSLSSFSGAWISAMSGRTPDYWLADGNGKITDTGAFSMLPATYSVLADGTLNITTTGNNPLTITSSFTSPTTASYTFQGAAGSFTKVTNVNAGQGAYTGTISKDGRTYNISFSVDANGNISSFTSTVPGVTSISGGRLYTIPSGTMVFTVRTNLTNEYSQLSAGGAIVTNNFIGTLETDSNTKGTITLTRSNLLDIIGSWKYGTATVTLNSNNTSSATDSAFSLNVTGIYSMNGNQITVTDTGGNGSCPSNVSGIYNCTLSSDGNSLNFTAISDSCDGRSMTLNGKSFTRQ